MLKRSDQDLIVRKPEKYVLQSCSVVISVAFEIDRSRNHLPTLLYKLVYKLDRVYNGLFRVQRESLP